MLLSMQWLLALYAMNWDRSNVPPSKYLSYARYEDMQTIELREQIPTVCTLNVLIIYSCLP